MGGVLLTVAVLGVVGVTALCYDRPTVSEIEKRELAAKPALTAAALLSGSYTRELSNFFADTFPLRDVFRQLNNWVESLYGIKTVEIVGNVEQGDEIPDAPFTGE